MTAQPAATTGQTPLGTVSEAMVGLLLLSA